MSKVEIRRALILGHSGFIGALVCDRFRRLSPAIEVVGRSLPETDLTSFNDVQSFCELMDGSTAVLMLSGIKRQLGDTLDIFDQNLRMVTNFARLLERHPVSRIVYVSSCAVYGEEVDNTRITEQTSVQPLSLYGIAKYASECVLRNVTGRHRGMSLVCLRPPLAYGPGDTSKSYGPSAFVKSAAEDEEIVLWGDGSELREFLFVEDLARIIHEVMQSDYDGVLNAVTGQSHTFGEVLDILNGECGGRLVVRRRERSKGKVNNAFSNTRLMQVLPDLRFTSLEEGVRLTLSAQRGAAR